MYVYIVNLCIAIIIILLYLWNIFMFHKACCPQSLFCTCDLMDWGCRGKLIHYQLKMEFSTCIGFGIILKYYKIMEGLLT